LVDKAATADQRWKEAEGRCKCLFEELTFLWLKGSELCLTIVCVSSQDLLHKGMRFATAHYTRVATLLSALWAAVSLAAQSILGCFPTEVLHASGMWEMVIKFREQCLHLETFGSRICGLILGPADDQVQLAIHLEEAVGQLQVLQDEHRTLQNSVNIIEGHVNAAAASEVHWAARLALTAILSHFPGLEPELELSVGGLLGLDAPSFGISVVVGCSVSCSQPT
jgi:hypothetical protein